MHSLMPVQEDTGLPSGILPREMWHDLYRPADHNLDGWDKMPSQL